MIWQTHIEEEFEEDEILEGVLEGVQAYKSVKSLLSNSYVFCYNVYSTFFFTGLFFLLLTGVFYVSWIQGVYKIFYLQILSVCGLIFHFLNSTESLIWPCPVYQFFLLYIMLWVLYLRTLCQTQGLEDIFPICSFKNVIVSAFSFRYNIHFVNFCV